MYTATRSEPLDSITMTYLEFIYSLLTAAEANVRFKGLECEFSSHIQWEMKKLNEILNSNAPQFAIVTFLIHIISALDPFLWGRHVSSKEQGKTKPHSWLNYTTFYSIYFCSFFLRIKRPATVLTCSKLDSTFSSTPVNVPSVTCMYILKHSWAAIILSNNQPVFTCQIPNSTEIMGMSSASSAP